MVDGLADSIYSCISYTSLQWCMKTKTFDASSVTGESHSFPPCTVPVCTGEDISIGKLRKWGENHDFVY